MQGRSFSDLHRSVPFYLLLLVIACQGNTPWLICPDDVETQFDYIDVDGNLFANVTWVRPTINDSVIGTDTWTLVEQYFPGDRFPFANTVVEYQLTTATTSVTCNFTVSVVDNEDPIIENCPRDETEHIGNDPSTLFSWIEPTVTDNSEHVTISSSHQPGETFQSGITNVVYEAVDVGGNTVQCTFKLTIIGYPHSQYVRIDGVFTSGYDDKTLMLNERDCLIACLEEADFVCHSIDFKPDSEECVLSRTDKSMDGVETRHDIDYVYWERLVDNVAPSLSGCPYDLTRPTNTGVNYTIVTWKPPLFIDNSENAIVSNHNPGEQFFIGSTAVTYTATDIYDNIATCTFTIIVLDTEKPVASNCPQSIIHVLPDYVTSDQSNDITWDPPTWTDNSYMFEVNVTHEPLSSVFRKGQTPVTYTSIDPSGNTATCQFTVSVKNSDELYRIDIDIELQNIAFSDALVNKETAQFHALEHDVNSLMDGIYQDELSYTGSVVNGFSHGSVQASITLTFFEGNSEDERYYLIILLERTFTGELGDYSIGDIYVVANNGQRTILDACYTLPCPDDMTCETSDLDCYATCQNNEKYCLNEATCVASTGSLIECVCSDDDYYGVRCQIEDTWSQAELAALILGCVWVFLLFALFMLFVCCKISDNIGRLDDSPNSSKSDLIQEVPYHDTDKPNKCIADAADANLVSEMEDAKDGQGGEEESSDDDDIDSNTAYINELEDNESTKNTYRYTGVTRTEEERVSRISVSEKLPSTDGSLNINNSTPIGHGSLNINNSTPIYASNDDNFTIYPEMEAAAGTSATSETDISKY